MTTDYDADLPSFPNDMTFVDGSPALYEIYSGSINVSAVLPPNLTINQIGGTVIVSWPNTGSYAITIVNGTNSISVPQPSGSMFFRLSSL